MYSIRFTNRFKKDVKRCKKRGYGSLQNLRSLLQKGEGKLLIPIHQVLSQNFGFRVFQNFIGMALFNNLTIIHKNNMVGQS